MTAMSLVNGRSITYAYDVTETAYFHIELDHHGIVYAHGAPCESYVEEGAEEMPVLGHGGGLSRMRSHFRSALSPWIDRRQARDLIRDGLDSKQHTRDLAITTGELEVIEALSGCSSAMQSRRRHACALARGRYAVLASVCWPA